MCVCAGGVALLETEVGEVISEAAAFKQIPE